MIFKSDNGRFTYQSNEIWGASISESMTCKNLNGLSCAPAGWSDNVEEHVGDDAPVEIQGNTSEEDEEEAHVDVCGDKN